MIENPVQLATESSVWQQTAELAAILSSELNPGAVNEAVGWGRGYCALRSVQ